MPDAVVRVVIAEGEAQAVEDVELDLEPPALEVEKPLFKVIIERCEVIRDKVLIVGVVKVNVMFKTARGLAVEDEASVVCGDVRHCTAFVPFSVFIDLPGVRPGDECVVLCAGVEGAAIAGAESILKHPIKKVTIGFAVVVQVQVTRPERIDVMGRIRTPLSPAFVFPRR